MEYPITPYKRCILHRTNLGLSLVELLVVIAIIGILAAIIIVTVPKVRERAKESESVSNLRHIGLLHHMWIQENNGDLIIFSPLAENGIAAAWPLHLAVLAGINTSASDPETVSAENTVFASPFVDMEQRLDGQPGYGVNVNFGWLDNPWVAHHRKLFAATSPATTIAFAETYHGNRPASPWTHFVSPPDFGFNVRNGKVLIGWLDGHVSSEPVSVLSESRNHIPNYFWELDKSNTQ